jgi:hypothetical protein
MVDTRFSTMLIYPYKLHLDLEKPEFGRGLQEEEQEIIRWSKGASLVDQHFLYFQRIYCC